MQTDPPSVDDPATPPTEDRKARIARYVALFAMRFLMVTMMFATYVGTMHAPHPQGLPIAGVGADPAAARATADGPDSRVYSCGNHRLLSIVRSSVTEPGLRGDAHVDHCRDHDGAAGSTHILASRG